MTRTPTARSQIDRVEPEEEVPPKVWFTSDHHFGHTNILKFYPESRPFDTIHDMNVHLSDLWNKQVAPNDTVYHLGDFCWGSLQDAKAFFKHVKGKIILVPGNHDKWARSRLSEDVLPVSASGYAIQVVEPIHVVRVQGQTIVLCHYPMRSWPHSYYQSWHLYGHVHRPIAPWWLSMDVGVDSNEGHLYSFDGVREYMDQRKLDNNREDPKNVQLLSVREDD